MLASKIDLRSMDAAKEIKEVVVETKRTIVLEVIKRTIVLEVTNEEREMQYYHLLHLPLFNIVTL